MFSEFSLLLFASSGMLIYISPYFFLFPILFFKFIICRNLLPAKVLPGQRAHAAGQGGEGRCGAYAAGQGGEGI